MENISKQEAQQVLQYLGMVSKALVEGKDDNPGKKNTLTTSLTKLDLTIKDLSTTLGSIFNLLKKSIETRFQAENKRRYNEEEAILEGSKVNKPSISATRKEKMAEFMESPLLKAAVAAIAYAMLPEDIKEKISTFTSGVLSELGVTEDQITAIKNATEFITKSLLYFAGFKFGVLLADSLLSMIAAFTLFSRRLGLKLPAQLAILGAGAVVAGRGLASINKEITDIEEQFNKDLKGSNIEKPAVSSLPTTGMVPISRQTTNEEIKEEIAKRESGGNYDIVYQGTKEHPTTPPERTSGYGKKLTEMTISEVLSYQQNVLLPQTQGHIGKGPLGTTAVGKYQFIRPTLIEYASKAGYDINTTKFTPRVQERLADLLINEKKGSARSDQEFASQINQVWEGARFTAGDIKSKSSGATIELEKLKGGIDEDSKKIKDAISGANTTGDDVNKKSQENRAATNKAPSSVKVDKNTTNTSDASKLPNDNTPMPDTIASTRPGNDKSS